METLLQLDTLAEIDRDALPVRASRFYRQVFRKRQKPTGGGWETAIITSNTLVEAERERARRLATGWELHETSGF